MKPLYIKLIIATAGTVTGYLLVAAFSASGADVASGAEEAPSDGGGSGGGGGGMGGFIPIAPPVVGPSINTHPTSRIYASLPKSLGAGFKPTMNFGKMTQFLANTIGGNAIKGAGLNTPTGTGGGVTTGGGAPPMNTNFTSEWCGVGMNKHKCAPGESPGSSPATGGTTTTTGTGTTGSGPGGSSLVGGGGGATTGAGTTGTSGAGGGGATTGGGAPSGTGAKGSATTGPKFAHSMPDTGKKRVVDYNGWK